MSSISLIAERSQASTHRPPPIIGSLTPSNASTKIASSSHPALPLTLLMTRLITTFLLVVLLSSCSRRGSVTTGPLIKDRGTFPSPSGSSQLVISSKSRSLVDYKIVDVATKKEFAPDHLFSDAMRWAAFWQDDDTLWVHSSDIGLSVWQRDPQHGFSQVWLGKENELVPTIPDEIWDSLPSSSQRQWRNLRKKASTPDGAANGSKMSPHSSSSAP